MCGDVFDIGSEENEETMRYTTAKIVTWKREKLLPCPFCGGEAITHRLAWRNGSTKYWIVKCSDCRVTSVKRVNRDKAIKEWNTRATSTEEHTAEWYLERLKAFMDKDGRMYYLRPDCPHRLTANKGGI